MIAAWQQNLDGPIHGLVASTDDCNDDDESVEEVPMWQDVHDWLDESGSYSSEYLEGLKPKPLSKSQADDVEAAAEAWLADEPFVEQVGEECDLDTNQPAAEGEKEAVGDTLVALPAGMIEILEPNEVIVANPAHMALYKKGTNAEGSFVCTDSGAVASLFTDKRFFIKLRKQKKTYSVLGVNPGGQCLKVTFGGTMVFMTLEKSGRRHMFISPGIKTRCCSSICWPQDQKGLVLGWLASLTISMERERQRCGIARRTM
jgi:hypothetical protein